MKRADPSKKILGHICEKTWKFFIRTLWFSPTQNYSLSLRPKLFGWTREKGTSPVFPNFILLRGKKKLFFRIYTFQAILRLFCSYNFFFQYFEKIQSPISKFYKNWHLTSRWGVNVCRNVMVVLYGRSYFSSNFCLNICFKNIFQWDTDTSPLFSSPTQLFP